MRELTASELQAVSGAAAEPVNPRAIATPPLAPPAGAVESCQDEDGRNDKIVVATRGLALFAWAPSAKAADAWTCSPSRTRTSSLCISMTSHASTIQEARDISRIGLQS